VEEQLLVMERNGYPEETYYTFSYSPIPDDDGTPGGIICANTDDTQRVIGERQLALLRELAAQTLDARTWTDVCRRSVKALSTDRCAIPFPRLYMAPPGSETLALAAASGVAPGAPGAPLTLSAAAQAPWPVAQALATHAPLRVELGETMGHAAPHGAWD